MKNCKLVILKRLQKRKISEVDKARDLKWKFGDETEIANI